MESNYRHEDFQSSYRTGTMCYHRSLLVSIPAFNGAALSLHFPIPTHSYKWFFQSTFKARESETFVIDYRYQLLEEKPNIPAVTPDLTPDPH
jgi:hypothetical protein